MPSAEHDPVPGRCRHALGARGAAAAVGGCGRCGGAALRAGCWRRGWPGRRRLLQSPSSFGGSCSPPSSFGGSCSPPDSADGSRRRRSRRRPIWTRPVVSTTAVGAVARGVHEQQQRDDANRGQQRDEQLRRRPERLGSAGTPGRRTGPRAHCGCARSGSATAAAAAPAARFRTAAAPGAASTWRG